MMTRSCKHYSPSSEAMRIHSGLAIAKDYSFDRTLPVASCICPALVGKGVGECSKEAAPTHCPQYEAEESVEQLAGSFVDSQTGKTKYLVLTITRQKFGIQNFVLVERDERNSEDGLELSRWDAHELGEAEARLLAVAEFTETLNRLEDGQQINVSRPPVNSYLEEVMSNVKIPA